MPYTNQCTISTNVTYWMHINQPLWRQKLNEGQLHHFKITARTVKIHQVYWVTNLQSIRQVFCKNAVQAFPILLLPIIWHASLLQKTTSDFKWRLSSMTYFIYFLFSRHVTFLNKLLTHKSPTIWMPVLPETVTLGHLQQNFLPTHFSRITLDIQAIHTPIKSTANHIHSQW